jgi:hypothetical protein
MPLALSRKNPERTKYLGKIPAPSFCWFRTFCGMQNGAEKKYGKIKIKTNVGRKN